jgi:adenine-specific DNA-methyltransferase
MAKLEQLLQAVTEPELRAQLEAEVASLKSRTRFGLVFERHLPETVIVGDIDPLNVGDHVRPRVAVDVEEDFRVIDLNGGQAKLVSLKTDEESDVAVKDLLTVKRFNDPAYTSLEPLDSISRNDDRPYHAVINGENFHVLQSLAYALENQVDCIYIDPPYNSGASDWKYNNRFVDATDDWRHSKWLSFMEKRLRIAKRLLKADGVLIVTIDENEVSHLGVLLEELFPKHQRTMVTIVINPKGTAKTNFSRVEEYAYFVVPDTGNDVIAYLPRADDTPEAEPIDEEDLDETEAEPEAPDEKVGELPATASNGTKADEEEDEEDKQHYSVLFLRRRGAESSAREDRPRQFYAIYVNEKTKTVEGIGPELALDDPYKVTRKGDTLTVYPIDGEGNERVWRYGRDTMTALIDAGDIRVGRYNKKLDSYTLNHWKPVAKERVGLRRIRTVWWRTAHDAGTHGTTLITRMLGKRNAFPFPKSVYAVRDALEAVVKDRPDALILDFFAGSGTTLHATCLLNAEDGGRRRSILVTNNEVDPKTTRKLNKQGLYRTDPEFEAHGIFEVATKPRVVATVTGKRTDGTPIPDGKSFQHLDGRPFSQGFEENVEFFRLDYLDGDAVELGQAFESIHPLLWLAAGARGPRPEAVESDDFFISPECGYAVLFRDDAFRDFEEALAKHDDISHVFLATDSDEAYAEMRERIGVGHETAMLYRDFLRHFRRRAR